MNEDDTKIHSIMAEDHAIFANLETNGYINIVIENENGDEVYNETSHPYAWESLVSFAKMILVQDKKIQKQLDNQ